jgi:hypothetical protein
MDAKENFRITTFQLSHHLHSQLRMMCTLTNKSMGEFIRIAISDKIKTIKSQSEKR